MARTRRNRLDNFAAAMGLDLKDGSGWDAFADYAAESSAYGGRRPQGPCLLADHARSSVTTNCWRWCAPANRSVGMGLSDEGRP